MTVKAGSITKLESATVGVALVLMSVALLRPSIRGHDGPGHYVYLRSILLGGDLDFTDDYAAFDRVRQADGNSQYRLGDAPISPQTGLPANRYGIGAAIFWAPFVVCTHGAMEWLAPDLADGLSPPYETAVGVASAWWGCLALWLMYLHLREVYSRRASVISLVGMILATPLGFYVWAHGSMSHAVSFFVVTCAVLNLDRFLREPRLGRAMAVGGWSGMIVVTRAQDGVWAMVFMGMLAAWLFRRGARGADEAGKGRRETLIMLACAWAAFVVTLLPQIVVWRVLYGSWLSGPAPYLNREGGVFSVLPAHLLDALFSGRHGALAWHPILIAGLAGLAWMTVKKEEGEISTPARWMAWGGLVGFAGQAWLVGSWSMWWAGASFGNRFFVSSYPLLIPGLASGIEHWGGRVPRWVVPAVALLLVAWNAGLLIQYGAEIIPREDAVALSEIVANQFTKVPQWLSERLRGGF